MLHKIWAKSRVGGWMGVYIKIETKQQKQQGIVLDMQKNLKVQID